MKRNYLIIFVCGLLLAGCSSGKKRLEQGDYDTAVYKAVKRLNQKPNHAKAEKVVRQAYVLAVKEHMNSVAYHDRTSNQFKYDFMVKEYQAVSNLNRAIRKYPQYGNLLELVDVSDELISTLNLASNAHVQKGNELMKIRNKEDAREAYGHYELANSFVDGSVSLNRLYEAQEAGTVNVRIEFARKRTFFKDYNADHVYNSISRGFRDSRYRFMRLIDASDHELQADQIIQIEMEEAHIGRVDVNKSVFEMSKDDVYMGEATTDSGEVVEVYGTVYVDYIEFCKTIDSRARILVQRVNGSSHQVITSDIFPSTFTWTEKWATYRGDKRALSKGQLLLVANSEPSIPNPMWLFTQASEPLIGMSLDFLRSEFNYLR